MKKFKDYFYIIYIGLLIFLLIGYFEPINIVWTIIYYIIYYGLSLLAILLLKNIENQVLRMIYFIITYLLLSILSMVNILLALPILLIFILISSVWKYLLLVVSIFIIIIAILLNSNYDNEHNAKAEVSSPNNKYKLIHMEYDDGELSGSQLIYLEKKIVWLGIKYKKQVAELSWQGNIEMEWIDNNSYIINDNEFEVK